MRKCVTNYRTGRLCVILALMLFAHFANAQSLIKGVVKADDGTELPGVNIMIKGSSKGVITDMKGAYSISATKDQTLIFSYIGFLDQEVPIGNQTKIDIQLQADVKALDEVVVVGYGEVKKSDATGAMASMTPKDFNPGVVLAPEQMMQGKVAGVNISQNSGQPGIGSTVRIRGTNSVSFNNEPMYVIDGVPVAFSGGSFATGGTEDRSSRSATNPLNMLNPADIERIDVLKDASATAIYGSRASNGVILITTKRASKDAKLEYNTYVGASQIRKKMPILSATQMRDFVAQNPEAGKNFNDGGADVDWQDEIFRTGVSQSHNMAYSGGYGNTTFRASVGYSNQEGIIIQSDVENLNSRMNLTSGFFNNKLKINTNVAYSMENTNSVPLIAHAGGGGQGDVIRDALRANPTIPVMAPLDDNGISTSPYAGGYSYIHLDVINPVEQAVLHSDVLASKRFIGNMDATLQLTEHFRAKVNVGLTEEYAEKKTYVPLTSRLGYENDGMASLQSRNNNNKIIESTFHYDRTIFGSHSLKILGGYSWQEFTNTGTHIRRYGFIEDANGADGIGAGEIVKTAASYKNDSRIISFFGRVNYDIKDKYLITATVRRDGSTRFAQNNKWGYFPSAAVGWKISEENFLKNVSAVELLKLRAGYGITGNQAIPNYGSQALIKTGVNLNPEFGLIANASTLPNPDLRWESTTQINFGLDYSFFEGKLSGSVDAYSKSTNDLILSFVVPPPTAVQRRLENVGEVSNKGVEINMNYTIFTNKNWSVDVYGNWSRNINRVESLSKGALRTPDFGILGYTAPSPLQQSQVDIIRVGEPLRSLFGYEFIGFDEHGNERFKDINGDGKIDSDDRTIIGNGQPDFTYGFGANTSFKGLSLSFFFRGVQGQEVLNSTRNDLENIAYLPDFNALDAVLTNGAAGPPSSQVSSRFVEDASFLRLDNITLGYTFNTQKWSFISNLNVYVTGQNLFLMTNYTGFDPEMQTHVDFTTYPRPRTLMLGLRASF